MNDLISRQAAIDEIDEWIKAFRENGHKESAADACLIQDGIIQLPPAQPEKQLVASIHIDMEDLERAVDEQVMEIKNALTERKTGRWIKASDADGDYYICSECGEELPRYTTEPATWDCPFPYKYSIDKTDFCPNCGSYNGGEQDG